MAAAARPYWTGFLKLSLVTIAVRLYTATTERERIRFHMIHEPTGERVRQQLVVPGTTSCWRTRSPVGSWIMWKRMRSFTVVAV